MPLCALVCWDLQLDLINKVLFNLKSQQTCRLFFIMESHVRVLFGTYSFGRWPSERGQEFLDLLKKHNIKDLDTAYLYVSKGTSLKTKDSSSLYPEIGWK